MEKIKLFIVEDDPVWLNGISTLLSKEEGFCLVGTAASSKEVHEVVYNIDVDIILMDLKLEDDKYDGITLSQEILNLTTV